MFEFLIILFICFMRDVTLFVPRTSSVIFYLSESNLDCLGNAIDPCVLFLNFNLLLHKVFKILSLALEIQLPTGESWDRIYRFNSPHFVSVSI